MLMSGPDVPQKGGNGDPFLSKCLTLGKGFVGSRQHLKLRFLILLLPSGPVPLRTLPLNKEGHEVLLFPQDNFLPSILMDCSVLIPNPN